MSSKPIKSKDIYGNIYDVVIADLSWRPAAYGIVVHDNKILLVRERDNYHMPGGGLDLGETPEDAVIRELKEEAGVEVDDLQAVGTLTSYFAYEINVGAKEMAHVQSLLLYYKCTYVAGELSTDGLDKFEKAYGLTPEWVDLDKLDTITVGTTVDWRPLVKRVLEL